MNLTEALPNSINEYPRNVRCFFKALDYYPWFLESSILGSTKIGTMGP